MEPDFSVVQASFFYAAEKPEKSTRRGSTGGDKTAPAQAVAAIGTRIFFCGRYRGLLAICYFSVITWRLKWADSCRFASFWPPFFVWFWRGKLPPCRSRP